MDLIGAVLGSGEEVSPGLDVDVRPGVEVGVRPPSLELRRS